MFQILCTVFHFLMELQVCVAGSCERGYPVSQVSVSMLVSYGTSNLPLTMRLDMVQCNIVRHAGWQLTPLSCRMKVEYKGVVANARAPKASTIFAHFFRCYG